MKNIWKSLRPARGEAREKKYEIVLRTHSKNYVKIVLDSLNNDNITLHDASYYLSMNLKHLNDLHMNF